MGVPKFFRWVAERYPLVITPFQDSPPPVDNLYLDMNGIIHHCSHPNDVDASKKSLSEREMVEAMFAYLEKIFQAIQPKKYFYLAVDGCAPRAKMNQQRQRRFRSGFDMMVSREEALARGEDLPEEGEVFDSNCITPGTEFMHRVGEQFKYFLTMKIHQDSAWRNCKIIFSGHDQPGEGEHKIVDFVRRRKMQPDYDPNEKHVMYGLDADLIMLALATHEPNFILLREVVSFTQQSKKEKERAAEDEAKGIKEAAEYGKPETFVLFHIKVLREYLDKDIRRGGTYPNYNLERVLDDFVFMCFFIGNDFMPSIPTLSINDGSLTQMFDVYREQVLSKGTNLLRPGGVPNWNAVEDFLAELSKHELDTLRARQDEELEYQKRRAKIDPSHEVHISSTPIASIAEYKEKFYRDKHGFRDGWQPRGPEMHELKQHFIEGIMWVLEYYFQGPPSWKWFYPHHYAPMASDMVNLTVHGTNVKFDRGQAFKPHQQLLAVLPPSSYRSMPKAYWPLLRSATSPLAKYFPKHLEIDREGARAPWEGTVLIPFLDEKVLLAAYESVQADLTPEDHKQNEEGPAVLFEYDPDQPPYKLSNAMFNTIPDVRVRRTTYTMPELKTGGFIPALCNGVRLGPQHIEGYGSLFAHDHESTVNFEVGAVSIFGRPSRKESLLINFNEGEAVTVDDVMHVLGKEVWINFPHYKRGRVCCIVDRRRRISAQWDKDGNFINTVSENLTAEEYRQFKKETETHQQFLKSKCGIVLPNIDVLVYVNRFVGMRISRKGRFLHQWSRRDTCYPLQLVSQKEQIEMLEDARYAERDRTSGDFGQGQQVLYLGPDPKGHRGESVTGAIGYVIETQRTGQDDFSTLITRQFAKPQAVPQGLLSACASDNWLSLHDLTDRLRSHLGINLNGMAVSQICGSITTSAQWGSFELGLCLKFSAKNLARVGLAKLVTSNYNPWYVGNSNLFETMEQGEGNHYLDDAANERRQGGGKGGKGGHQDNQSLTHSSQEKGHWYFSSEAFKLIAEYCQKFLPLVQRIVAGGHNHLSFDMAQVLNGPWADKDADAVQKMIVEWLEGKGVHTMPMIAATDDAFTKDVVLALEDSLEKTTPRPTQELKLRRVLGRHIHIPAARAADGSVVAVPLPARDQKYAIGNRVVYSRTTGIVPFGATGTIVRLLGDGKSCDVVFDEPFVGGSHLGGRLQTTRGGLCKLAALLVTSAKPTGVFDPAAPGQTIDVATGKPFAAPAPQETPSLQSQQPKGADAKIPSPKSQQKQPQPKQSEPTPKQAKQQEKAASPAAPAAQPLAPAPQPAVQAASTAPRRWNTEPPRHTANSARNALMSRVSELLAARKQQQQ